MVQSIWRYCLKKSHSFCVGMFCSQTIVVEHWDCVQWLAESCAVLESNYLYGRIQLVWSETCPSFHAPKHPCPLPSWDKLYSAPTFFLKEVNFSAPRSVGRSVAHAWETRDRNHETLWNFSRLVKTTHFSRVYFLSKWWYFQIRIFSCQMMSELWRL